MYKRPIELFVGSEAERLNLSPQYPLLFQSDILWFWSGTEWIDMSSEAFKSFGWVNGAWQKNPLMFGYSGTAKNEVNDTALAAGNNNLDGAAVPAGEIWVITNVAFRYNGTVTGVTLTANAQMDGTAYQIFGQNPPVSNVWYDRQTYVVLNEGDYIWLSITGATLNDDAHLRMFGFKVEVAQ